VSVTIESHKGAATKRRGGEGGLRDIRVTAK